MMRIRSAMFGLGITAALGFGIGAAQAEATSLEAAMVPCGTQQTESACAFCCQRLGMPYFWDDEFGCACGTKGP